MGWVYIPEEGDDPNDQLRPPKPEKKHKKKKKKKEKHKEEEQQQYDYPTYGDSLVDSIEQVADGVVGVVDTLVSAFTDPLSKPDRRRINPNKRSTLDSARPWVGW